ncbi:hypothetical protein [Clostridium tyrobutyricum]|uniref:hypothetical protein n=1 Tax=Clostridium tyrobutyricum TaxID=1519 RepID=UPI00073D52E3|nr:hypothetical protein [Clostridium tyrobutyricum]
MIRAKDYFQRDLDTFTNLDEFAEEHFIDNRKIKIVVDNDELKERTKNEYDGIYVGDILYFVNSSEYGRKPEIDAVQIFDGVVAAIFDVKEISGMYEIILKFNRS